MNNLCPGEEQIILLIDGELSTNDKYELLKHIDTCDKCNTTYSHYLDLDRNISEYYKHAHVRSSKNKFLPINRRIYAYSGGAAILILLLISFIYSLKQEDKSVSEGPDMLIREIQIESGINFLTKEINYLNDLIISETTYEGM
jgi:hypothetical protein